MDYSKIPTKERVKLTIQALARKDIKEIKALLDSSPIETVEVHSLEYLNTFRMLPRVAALFELELRGIVLTMASNMSNEGAKILTQCLDEVAAAKEAWIGFCSDYEVSPEDLIATAGGHHPAVANALATTLDANPLDVKRWRELFRVAASGEVIGEIRH
ncbi:hypothetical protein [Pseudomonas antarctica]|uniref:hypothetical protein n=1 Tax=Pseudomonas antarctica TaxID=219572 RepID=UPI003F7533AE